MTDLTASDEKWKDETSTWKVMLPKGQFTPVSFPTFTCYAKI